VSPGAADGLARCREALAGAGDAFALVWDGRASDRDRRLLLALGGVAAEDAACLRKKAWRDLRPEVRGAVKRGLTRFKVWADGLAAS